MRVPETHLYFQTFSKKPLGISRFWYDKENILFSFRSWNVCHRRVLPAMPTHHTISSVGYSCSSSSNSSSSSIFSFKLKSAWSHRWVLSTLLSDQGCKSKFFPWKASSKASCPLGMSDTPLTWGRLKCCRCLHSKMLDKLCQGKRQRKRLKPDHCLFICLAGKGLHMSEYDNIRAFAS